MGTTIGKPHSTAAPPAWLQAALLTVLAAAALAPGLDAGFIWDDTQQILDSPLMGDASAPFRFFGLNVVASWGGEGRGGEGIDTYRPFFFLVLWSVYRINGADPVVFHLAVTAAHLAVCLLLWALARRWLGSDRLAAAIFAVFAVHPVTAEAYLWVSAISEPLSVAGVLGACLILDRWCRSGRRSLPAAAAAAVAMLAGLLSKEAVAAALPPLTWYLWAARGVRRRQLAAPWAAVAVYLALRVSALDGLQATGAGGGQRFAALRNLPVLVLDGLRALVTLQPVGVRQLYWDYRDITVTTALIAAVAVTAGCAVAWRLRRRLPLIPTAVAVLICMLAPIALITTAPGWGGFGRYLYLPLGMVALAVAQAVRSGLGNGLGRPIRLAIAAAVIIFIALELVGLRQALAVFHSQENLARASVELQPHAPDGWEWLGNHFLAVGDVAAAARCWERAVAIEPGIERPRHNLSVALLALGRPSEALAHAEAVASMHGVTPEGAAVAAAASMALERWSSAARWILLGLDRDPRSARLHELAAELLRRHPEPDALRGRLAAELQDKPDRPAAAAIRPLIEVR